MSRFQTAILGDLPAFSADPIGFVERRAIGAAKPVPLRFGPKPAMLIAQPSAMRQVLVDDRDRYGKGSEQARLRPLFGDGMITASGDRWKAARDSTKSGFNASGLEEGMKLAMRCLAGETARLATKLGQVLSLHDIMGKLSMRMATAALFHARLDDATTNTLYSAGATVHRRLSETMWRLVDIDAIFPTEENRKFKSAIKDFEKVVAELADDPKGILGMLRSITDEYGDQVLRDEAITMLVAGFETTATAACWVTYALACRPDIVASLKSEADQALSDEWEISPDSLKNMPKIRAFVQEVLRLYPSTWWFARTALAEGEIDGVPVSKGTSILLCPWALHRQPDLWQSPTTLDPKRFLNTSPPEKFAYVPFGAGPRTCIGMHLAMSELTAITAMLVSAFELEPLSGRMEDIAPFGGVTLGLPADLNIRLHMRSQLKKVA